MLIRVRPWEFQNQSLMPYCVISLCKINQQYTHLVSHFKGSLNVICQLHSLVNCAASSLEPTLLIWELGVNHRFMEGNSCSSNLKGTQRSNMGLEFFGSAVGLLVRQLMWKSTGD